MTASPVPKDGQDHDLPIEPLRNFILAKETHDGTRTNAGMILPSNTLGQPAYAEVKDVGPEVTPQFVPGDIILYRKADGVTVYADGTEYLLIKSDAVMARTRPRS